MEPIPDPHPGARLEVPHTQGLEIETVADLGVGRQQDLEAPVEQVSVDPVGADPTPDAVGGLEDQAVHALSGQVPGADQPGRAGPDDDNVAHQLSVPASPLNGPTTLEVIHPP